MRWRDEGILLSNRRFGETSIVISVFTELHGRHTGLVKGGAARRFAAARQQGTQLIVEWKGRLPEHLGSFSIEPVKSRASAILSDRLRLSAMTTVCALVEQILPERDPVQLFYGQTRSLLDSISDSEHWIGGYLRWELQLLREAGRGLDLTRCAATGTAENLIYISPRSGRAVSADGAGEWAPRLLPLPRCLIAGNPGDLDEAKTGLNTIGWFVEKVLEDMRASSPALAVRRRFVDALGRSLQDQQLEFDQPSVDEISSQCQ